MIATNKKDVIWNYIGTFTSMVSGFILLPLLMRFLTDDELGLWYVYIAIANLAVLFEFGFNPTFARNIVYVVSGAKKLCSEGVSNELTNEGVDWHLLNVVIKAAKTIYAAISAVVLIALLLFGIPYISYITSNITEAGIVWISWAVFVLAIVLNLYFLYSISILRGYGDIAGENKAKTFAKLLQLMVSGALLLLGFGLIGASIGYLINSLFLRVFAIIRVRGHREIEDCRKSDDRPVSSTEIKDVLASVGHLAWRDGVVQLSSYVSSQGMSIMSSIYLGLSETGTYSIMLQFVNAIYNFACSYPKSFLPSMQSAFTVGDEDRQIGIASTGIAAYWMVYFFGVCVVCLVALPVLPFFKPGIQIDYLLFLGIALYMFLLQQHSLFCCYIISMNEIPYMWGYLAASLLGLGMVWVLCGYFGWGAWGIVLGQALSQVVYNNWKWPIYFAKEVNTTYRELIYRGFLVWMGRVKRGISSKSSRR